LLFGITVSSDKRGEIKDYEVQILREELFQPEFLQKASGGMFGGCSGGKERKESSELGRFALRKASARGAAGAVPVCVGVCGQWQYFGIE
jgi:hypothetical protein